MDTVFAAIYKGQHAEALIRLWLLAERSDESQVTNISRWQTPSKEALALTDLSLWLEQPDGAQQDRIAAAPLLLLQALDQHLAQQYRDSLPQTPIRLSVDGTPHYLLRRRLERAAGALKQSPNLSRWCKYHSVLPAYVSDSKGQIAIDYQPLSYGLPLPESIACRLSHFTDQNILLAREDGAAGNFLATGLSNPASREASLTAEIEHCLHDGAYLWVAPELTAPHPMQKSLAKQLARTRNKPLLLVVPGSFHHQENSGDTFNSTQILTGRGKSLSCHRKLTQFSYSHPGPDGLQEFSEAILIRQHVTLFDTPIGLIGVAICKDYSDESNALVHHLWNQIAPDWLLVPSYGNEEKTLKLHRERATDHWTLRSTRTLLANQEIHYQAEGQELQSSEVAPGFAQASESRQDIQIGGETIRLELFPAQKPHPEQPQRPQLTRIK